MNDASGGGASPVIAGHAVSSQEHAGGLLNLRIALGGAPLVTLARALAKLDGVRVTTGPEVDGRQRCYLVHCAGFKLVLSAPAAEPADHAVALVSRSPRTALAILSELDVLLERLMSAPPPQPEARPAPAEREEADRSSLAPRRSALRQGTPLTRKSELKRKTPLARGRFNRL